MRRISPINSASTRQLICVPFHNLFAVVVILFHLIEFRFDPARARNSFFDRDYSSRKKNTLMIGMTPNPIRINGPTTVHETCVSLMIQIAMGMEQKKARLRIPCQIFPRKINEALLERPMATMIPGHHQPVQSKNPRLIKKILPEIASAMRFLS